MPSMPGTTRSPSWWKMAHTRDARLALSVGTGQVLKNGLDLLGVSAPEKM